MKFRLPPPDDKDVFDFVKSRFTFAEAKFLEKHGGVRVAALDDLTLDDLPVDVLQAMFCVSIKRLRPTFTYAELEDVAIDEIEFLPEDDTERVSMEEHGVPLGPTSPAPDSGDPDPTTTPAKDSSAAI